MVAYIGGQKTVPDWKHNRKSTASTQHHIESNTMLSPNCHEYRDTEDSSWWPTPAAEKRCPTGNIIGKAQLPRTALPYDHFAVSHTTGAHPNFL